MTNLGQHSLDIVHWFLDAHGPAGRHQRRRAVRPAGQRRDARHAGRAVRIPGLDGDLVAARVQPGRARAEGWSSAAREGA